MKKILSFFAILSILGGVAYAYDADGNANKKREIEGAPAYSPFREYELVRYGEQAANTPSLSAGDVVVADCVSDDGITVGLVGTTQSTDAVRGVVVSATIPTADVAGTTASTDFGRRNWGYIQVKGLCSKVNVISGPAIAGGTLIASSTARYATAALSAGTTTPTSSRSLGFAYDASEVGQSKAYITT